MEKKRLFIYALLIIAATGAACPKEEGISRYFRHAYLNGRYEIQGTYPVQAEEKNSVDCYRFVLDGVSRITKVEYLQGGKPTHDPYFGVARILFEYTPGVKKMLFAGSDGEPAPGKSGAYALLLKLDEHNNPVHLSHLNREGLLTENIHGVAHYAWTLDAEGRRIKSALFDAGGRRIRDKNGYYELRYRYDEQGNIIEMANYGEDRQLLGNTSGIAIIRQKFDGRHNITEQTYFDTHGKRKENRDGFATVRMRHDGMGNTIKQSHFGTDEQLKGVREGIATWQMTYDERGRTVKTTTFDRFGNKLREYIPEYIQEENRQRQ